MNADDPLNEPEKSILPSAGDLVEKANAMKTARQGLTEHAGPFAQFIDNQNMSGIAPEAGLQVLEQERVRQATATAFNDTLRKSQDMQTVIFNIMRGL